MSDTKVVAIHQPNFFPWLGYFNKIVLADQFIIMDSAQFSKKGGTWVNRVRLAINGQPAWVTMPVVRAYHGLRSIREMRIDDTTPWRPKLLKTIEANYRRAPFYDEAFSFLAPLISNPSDSLTEYNLSAIIAFARAFRIETSKLIIGSTLNAEGSATDLLIAMVKAVDGTAYLCGGGATGYQEDEKFAAAGIELIYQNFEHPIYEQSRMRDGQEFVPGLSIIDALMNCGFEKTRLLIQRQGEAI
jgi:hypothetical protein